MTFYAYIEGTTECENCLLGCNRLIEVIRGVASIKEAEDHILENLDYYIPGCDHRLESISVFEADMHNIDLTETLQKRKEVQEKKRKDFLEAHELITYNRLKAKFEDSKV